ncbi:MAG: prolipoprotein diacylglyceryl transferase [Coriobacteriales bacterium]|nr:prolipoprotein diacylglyceryl transferase [Coriobacteriales bacterium]
MLDDLYHFLDPTAFWLGSFPVRWYGLGYFFGLAIGAIVILRTAKRWNLKFTLDSLLVIILAATLGIIIGGRVGFILFYGNGYYFAHPLEILAINNGGMSFHGGVIGMAVAVPIAARLTKIAFLTIADLVVIAAPIGIFLVRCANFINGELWGAVTDLPWGVVFDDSGGGTLPRHPTQLYEACLEGIVMFVVLQVLSRRKSATSARGFHVGIFLCLYAIFRISIEFVRQPDVQLGYLFGDWFTMGMLLSLPLLAGGIALVVYSQIAKKPQRGEPIVQMLADSNDTLEGEE